MGTLVSGSTMQGGNQAYCSKLAWLRKNFVTKDDTTCQQHLKDYIMPGRMVAVHVVVAVDTLRELAGTVSRYCM
jgi:hypothetical protein